MKTLRIASVAALAAMTLTGASALEIPLAGTAGAGGGRGGSSIGFVDMDRIFQIYPQTANAKEDYANQLQKKRDQLAEKEAQVNNLKSKIAILESSAKDLNSSNASSAASVAPSSMTAEQGAESSAGAGATPAGSPQNLQDMKAQLESQMAEYDDMRKQAEKDLAVFQSQQSQMILGKIYEALRDLAQEEQISVVVDKSAILYGDTAIDLTDKLQAKVRGY